MLKTKAGRSKAVTPDPQEVAEALVGAEFTLTRNGIRQGFVLRALSQARVGRRMFGMSGEVVTSGPPQRVENVEMTGHGFVRQALDNALRDWRGTIARAAAQALRREQSRSRKARKTKKRAR